MDHQNRGGLLALLASHSNLSAVCMKHRITYDQLLSCSNCVCDCCCFCNHSDNSNNNGNGGVRSTQRYIKVELLKKQVGSLKVARSYIEDVIVGKMTRDSLVNSLLTISARKQAIASALSRSITNEIAGQLGLMSRLKQEKVLSSNFQWATAYATTKCITGFEQCEYLEISARGKLVYQTRLVGKDTLERLDVDLIFRGVTINANDVKYRLTAQLDPAVFIGDFKWQGVDEIVAIHYE